MRRSTSRDFMLVFGTERLSPVLTDREEPKQRVGAEDRHPISPAAVVIVGFVLFVIAVTEL